MNPNAHATFLRARDPSIVTFNRPRELHNIRLNLVDALTEQETQREERENNEKIQVFLRVKKVPKNESSESYQFEDKTLTCTVPHSSNFGRNLKPGEVLKKTYTFSRVFDANSSQKTIFQNIVQGKVLDFINGQHISLLTYGASGSGKTFTVIGTDEEPGILPRCLEYLFKTIPQVSVHPEAKPLQNGQITMLNPEQQQHERQHCERLINTLSIGEKNLYLKTYKAMQQRLSHESCGQLDEFNNISVSVWVSYAEIHNESIYDLLQPNVSKGKQQRPRLRLASTNNEIYIRDLTNVFVSSGVEAFQILKSALENLTYASTKVNSHSSRSHSIFTIKLLQLNMLDGSYNITRFNICDLAGSERSKLTQNVGERQKESNNINNSLTVLGRCIQCVRKHQKANNDQGLVPFRESKLTQIFQKALSGCEDIGMIITISPLQEVFDESWHTLNFSAIAQQVSVERTKVVTKKAKANRFSMLVEADSSERIGILQNRILDLETEMAEQQIEAENNERHVQEVMCARYDAMVENIEKMTLQRIESAKGLVREEFRLQIKTLKAEIKQLKYAASVQTITIDDEEVDELQHQIAEKDQQIAERDREIEELRQCNRVLKETLNEGVADYKALQKELEAETEQQAKTIVELNLKRAELEAELESCLRENQFRQDLWSDSGSMEDVRILYNDKLL